MTQDVIVYGLTVEYLTGDLSMPSMLRHMGCMSRQDAIYGYAIHVQVDKRNKSKSKEVYLNTTNMRC